MGRPRILLPALLLLAAAAVAGCGSSSPVVDLKALASAERALEDGRTVEARRVLMALSTEALPTGPSRRRAAQGLMKLQEYSRAADLLAGDPPGKGGRNGEASMLRLESLIRSGRIPEAGTFIVEIERVGLGGDRRRVLRAMLDLVGGNRGDGQRELARMVREGTRDADAWVLWAQDMMDVPAEAERRLLQGLGAVNDRITILRALGRLLLRSDGDARRSVEAFEEVVKARPWDRESRLDLVSALRRTGGVLNLDRARALAEGLRAEDPGDFGASLALAEVLGEAARSAAEAPGANPASGRDPLLAAIALYGELAGRPAPDAATAVRVLQGLARAHIQGIYLDAQGDAGPNSHFRAALDALLRAENLDPEGKLRDGRGRSLRAETWYQRARAFKRVHAADGDHTEAVNWYEKAAREDPRHLDAMWDLALLYYDFLRTPEYMRKARRLVDRVLEGRDALGLPPLDEERQRIVIDIRARDDQGRGLGQDEPGGGGKEQEKGK